MQNTSLRDICRKKQKLQNIEHKHHLITEGKCKQKITSECFALSQERLGNLCLLKDGELDFAIPVDEKVKPMILE